MPEARTLFDKALSNFNTARILRDHMGNDEEQLNMIAYHLQQALELSMKYTLEMNGLEYPKTHDLETLIRLAEQVDVDLRLTEYIEDHCEMFSQWEAKSRYILGYLVEVKKIDRALRELDRYFLDYKAAEDR